MTNEEFLRKLKELSDNDRISIFCLSSKLKKLIAEYENEETVIDTKTD